MIKMRYGLDINVWVGIPWWSMGRACRGRVVSLLRMQERAGCLTALGPPSLNPSPLPALGQTVPWEMPYSSKTLWQEFILQAPTLELFHFSKNQFPLLHLLLIFQNVLNLSYLEELRYYYYIMIHSHSSMVLRNRHVWLTHVSPSLFEGQNLCVTTGKAEDSRSDRLSSSPSSTICRFARLERPLTSPIPTLVAQRVKNLVAI